MIVLVTALAGLLAQLPPGEPELPAEVRAFVLDGHVALDYQAGDLDRDGKPDAVLVLRSRSEDPGDDDEELPRPLLLLVRQADGQLKAVRRNDRLVLCARCGGIMGDPYQGVKAEDGRFAVSHHGGSGWRWSNEYTFAYDPARKDWLLERELHESFHIGDPQTVTPTVIEREELGDVPLEAYAPHAQGSERQWRVVSECAHFYDRPRLRSSPRRAFVVSGDVVTGTRELRHFVQASFTNRQGGTTEGYLLKNDLAPLPDPAQR